MHANMESTTFQRWCSSGKSFPQSIEVGNTHTHTGVIFPLLTFLTTGDLIYEEQVLEWLKKNRYRHPELNFFMYAITAITGAFMLYTLFLIFCIKRKRKDEKLE